MSMSELPIEDVQDLSFTFQCPVCEETVTVSQKQCNFYCNHEYYVESTVLEIQCPECEDQLRIIIN
jgi:predicted RNA-binding Zn-ribbon protein involved in translation (DUF1610 family)